MTSSPSVPGPELTASAAAEPLAPAPLARLVHQARAAGYVLASAGAVGVLASLASASLLGFALAVVSAAAGAWLLRAVHQSGLPVEPSDGSLERSMDSSSDGVGMLALQALARACELATSLGRSVMKMLACLVAGTGTGLVTIGVFALRQPDLWEYDAVRRAGPPFAPVLLGAGVGLLTAEVLLLLLFRRSWSRPAVRQGVEETSD